MRNITGEKNFLQKEKNSDKTFTYLKNEKIVRTIQTCASKTTQADKRTSLNSSRMVVGDSKVIFINPKRLKMPSINKSLVPNRLVLPQQNSGNSEIQNSSTRKVFINPNFKQSVGKKICEKPAHGSLLHSIAEASIKSNTFAKPRIVNLNLKPPAEKTLEKNIENSLFFDGLKADNRVTKQNSSSKRVVIKPPSCYVNPHFKGLLPQKVNEFKKESFVQNADLKDESKCNQIPRRIVKIVKSISPSTKSHKPQVNEIDKTFENSNSDHIQVLKLPAEQEFNTEATVKLQALKKSKQVLASLKAIQHSLPCQQKEVMKVNTPAVKQCQKNTPQRIYLKKADCKDLSQPGPSKIYVNKEKWKSDLLKLNKSCASKPTTIINCEIKGSNASNDLQPGRNIYVNRLLLTKTIKESQLKDSMAVLKPKNARVNTQLLLTSSATSLIAKHKLIDSSKQLKANVIRPRKRSTSSTCLVSVSKTKMVRKNKSLVQVQPVKNVKKFEYLNKIKRLEIAKTLRNNRQVKRTILKNRFQYVNPNKITKVQKHSFVSTINNLVRMNINQKNKILNTNYISQSKLKEMVPVSKGDFKKSKYYLNRSKLNKQNLVKNWQIIKKVSPQKPVENACSSNKLVRSNSSVLILSPTKLVRKKLPTVRSTPIQTHKQLPSIQLARLVKSKYKFNRTVSTFKKSSFTNRMEIYKRIMKNHPYSISARKTYSQKKSLPSLVRIGGVFYKATQNKLTRNSAISSKAVANNGPVLQVRGQRFRLDKTGRTLMSLDQNVSAGVNKLRRVDIGGVTFIRSKQGTSLVRTNTHTARNRLIQAKQRSITLLTKNLRKNNQPCLLFHRFGRCTGKEKGTCNRIHNSNNIAICKKFVQGQCENTNCLLSHNVGPEKMPTCYHYLAGNCVRDNCPYLHVKVNSNAPVCAAFLQGYCADGDQCKKRHINMCPEFEGKGTCTKGKYCPYPHLKKKKTPKSKSVKRKEIKDKTPSVEVCQEEVSTCRYFDDERCTEVDDSVQNFVETHVQESVQVRDEDSSEWLVKRPKLGVLPAFIPLSMD